MVSTRVEPVMLDETKMQLAKAILKYGPTVINEMERAGEFNRLKTEMSEASSPSEMVRLAQEIAELGDDDILLEMEDVAALKEAFDAYDEELLTTYSTSIKRPVPALRDVNSNAKDWGGGRNGQTVQSYSYIGRNQCPMCPNTKKMDEETCFLCWAAKNPDLVDECDCGNTKKVEYQVCTPCHFSNVV